MKQQLAQLADAVEHLLRVMTGVEADRRRMAIARLIDSTPVEWVVDNGVPVSILRPRLANDAPGSLEVSQ